MGGKTLIPQKQLNLDLQDSDLTNVNVSALNNDANYLTIDATGSPAVQQGARLVYNGTAWVPDTTPVDAYDITIHAFGAITAPQQIALIMAVRDFRIEATGHTGYAGTVPAGTGSPAGAEIELRKNGTPFGLIVYGGSPNGFSFNITETDFTVDDRLEIVVLNDDGMEDFGFTLKGKVT